MKTSRQHKKCFTTAPVWIMRQEQGFISRRWRRIWRRDIKIKLQGIVFASPARAGKHSPERLATVHWWLWTLQRLLRSYLARNDGRLVHSQPGHAAIIHAIN